MSVGEPAGVSSRVHPTAIVDARAKVPESCMIGPYCVVEANVSIGEGSRLFSHVHITGHTSIGPRSVIYPFVSLQKNRTEPIEFSAATKSREKQKSLPRQKSAEGSERFSENRSSSLAVFYVEQVALNRHAQNCQ